MDPRGRFYVTVDYDNEMVALGAIRLAESMINALDRRDIAHIDMVREVTRLREIAKISRRLSAPPPPRPAAAPPDAFEGEAGGAGEEVAGSRLSSGAGY